MTILNDIKIIYDEKQKRKTVFFFLFDNVKKLEPNRQKEMKVNTLEN